MYTIDSVIAQKFNIIYQHPDSNHNDWDTFLLGEDHTDETIKAINGEFLKLFSDNQSVLLLEGIPSLQVDNRPQKSTDARSETYIGPNFTRNQIFGWDSDNYSKFDAKRDIIFMAKKLLQPYQSCDEKNSRIPLKNLDVTRIFLSVISKEEIKWQTEENSAEFQFIVNQFKELKKNALIMAEEITHYIKEELSEIEQKIEIQQPKLVDLINTKDSLENFSTDEDLEKYLAVFEQEMTMNTEIQELRLNVQKSVMKNYIELQERAWTFADHLFPERTNAMINTLKNVHSIVGKNRKIFLIAGSAHLREECGGLPENDLKSLKTLYTYLSTQKNIVLLIPKQTISLLN